MKRLISIVMVMLILMLTTVAASAMVISNNYENTRLEFREPGFVYVEFVQGSNSFPIGTDSGFIITTVTAEDADGNALGSVHSTDGVLDYSMYLGQAVRLHLTNSYTDEYIILPDENGEIVLPGADEIVPSDGDSAPSDGAPAPSGGGMHPLTIFGLVVLVIMISIVLTASITCAREKRKAK